jgi:hypothetical protein
MRRLSVVALCAALAFAPAGVAAAKATDRGIVVRVVPPRLVIRELDGSRLRFVITRRTVITVNGRIVRLAQLRRGDVAAVDHAGKVAVAIRVLRP